MNKEEYIEKGVTLYGYGKISVLVLDAEFFSVMEKINGEIAYVKEIKHGRGGISFSSSGIEGCIIVYKSGAVSCVESDGEYVDVFGGGV